MQNKPAETLEKSKARLSRLAQLRTMGLAQHAPEKRINEAEQSLAGAFALADLMDAIRRVAEP